MMNIRASMKRGFAPALKEVFPNYIPVDRTLIDATKLLPTDFFF